MRLSILAALLLALPAAAQPALVGTWGGKLPAGNFVLDIALDLRAEDGALTGALDIETQGVYGVPVRVEATGDSVRAVAPVGGIVIAGRAQGDTLRAVWTQPGAEIPLALVRQSGADLEPAVLDGGWSGQVAIIDEPLALRLGDGEGTARLGSGADLPITSLRLRGRRLFFSVPADSSRFEGVVLGDAISGTWSRPGGIYKTDLERDAARAALPYREEPLVVESRDGVVLDGTLTLPEGDGPFPAAVLVSGTGPQDRDESMLTLKPFAVLADAFARRGIATYRYDDRGVGASTGDFMAATLDDFAADASAAARALAARLEIGAVGIVGHSEGAFVAPEVSVETPEVAFVVMLAGAAIPGAQVYAAQHESILLTGGAPPSAAARHRAAVQALLDALHAGAPAADLRPTLIDAFRESLAEAPAADRGALGYTDDAAVTGAAGTIADFVLTPGIRSFVEYDPGVALGEMSVPALAVFGGLDVQIPLAETEAAMHAALDTKPGSLVLVLPDKNHLFQAAETGAMTEYTTAGMPMAPDLAAAVADWIVATASAAESGSD